MTNQTPNPRPRARTRTAKAVADRAGVSVTTVSRVLSGRGEAIPKATRDRVVTAAQELGYRPNSLAAALRKGTTGTVGLVIPDISDAYFHQVARGVEDVAQSAGYMVVFCNTDRTVEKELACVQLLDDKRADAVIFAGGGIEEEKHLIDYPWDRMWAVTIGPHHLPTPSIGVDDIRSIETSVLHLAAEGCTRILCIAGQQHWMVTRRRLEGYHRGMRRAGLALRSELIIHGYFGQEAGYDAVRRALSEGVAFDGIVAFNDYLAIGGMQALHESGQRIPDEVALIGCDDLPIASLVCPPLSTISFPQYELGRAAMRTVLDLLAGNHVETEVIFPFQLEARASTRRSNK